MASSYLLELVPDVQVCARGVCTCVCCGVGRSTLCFSNSPKFYSQILETVLIIPQNYTYYSQKFSNVCRSSRALLARIDTKYEFGTVASPSWAESNQRVFGWVSVQSF